MEFKDVKEGEYYPCLSINHGKNVAVLNSSARIPDGQSKPKKKESGGNESEE